MFTVAAALMGLPMALSIAMTMLLVIIMFKVLSVAKLHNITLHDLCTLLTNTPSSYKVP